MIAGKKKTLLSPLDFTQPIKQKTKPIVLLNAQMPQTQRCTSVYKAPFTDKIIQIKGNGGASGARGISHKLRKLGIQQ